MTPKIPHKLKKEPLIEAVWEVRFVSEKPSVAEVLPGMVYKALSAKYPTITRLPAADVPKPVQPQIPHFAYLPKVRLEGENQAVNIGECVVALNCRRPYSGWQQFSADIQTLAKVLQETLLIDHLERFSLKYINLIDLYQPPSLQCLNLKLEMAGYSVDSGPMQLYTEITTEKCTHILQVALPAEASVPGTPTPIRGVLVDIDSITQSQAGISWQAMISALDEVHAETKKIFFELLTDTTLKDLEPIYEE
ncbi:MAG TPA: TIGR04255 family protein [Chthonomonas sp.]|uniref:TIGR04255 family protein n=1 Tax=Chthonomonas sp. TaxID=2282153 RepID=UPI002B4B1D4D|nr:TIGR04255 family protein [Chthonomonas sp.]HLI47525.1 TIGR04255 family protein [Chthonomonas sp.]